MQSLPIHPSYGLEPQAPLDVTRYLVPGAAAYQAPEHCQDDALEALLLARSEGLEGLARRLDELIGERRQAGEQSAATISRDLTYLENLILDRYRGGERATDDRTYVKLRLEQLRLHSEGRQEQVSCWRDTVLLAKELAELARRVADAHQRDELLRGDAE